MLIAMVPGLDENDCFDDRALKNLLLYATLKAWQKKFLEVGKQVSTESLEAMAAFFDFYHRTSDYGGTSQRSCRSRSRTSNRNNHNNNNNSNGYRNRNGPNRGLNCSRRSQDAHRNVVPSEEPNSAQEPDFNVAAESSSASDSNPYDDNFQ